MMVRIQASEQLDAIRVGVLAAADKDTRLEAVRDLQRAVGARAKKATPGQLAGMGIGALKPDPMEAQDG